MQSEFTLKKIKEMNNEDRLWFVKYWANYVRTHPDKEWSKQQNVIINSQIQSAKACKLTPKQYLKIKGEICKRPD
tara:strand:+ start:11607 stop:11831 length:225 start_codon:yes stop_codon:yes gene_type:complete